MKHVAILRQPFFDMILSGEKTIESRFSMNKILPYKKVFVGDVIYLKQTGKPITVKAEVEKVEYYELTPEIGEQIRKDFGHQIGTDKFENWETTKQKRYCTLIWLKNVIKINPIEVPRSNGAGWLMLDDEFFK